MTEYVVENCVTLLALAVAIIMVSVIICNALAKRREIDQDTTHQVDRLHTAEKAADEATTQARKLQEGLRRISESRDPLQAFIDAISDGRDRDRRRRGDHA